MNVPATLIIHYFLMVLSVIFFISTMIIAIRKKDKQWMKRHRLYSTLGVVSITGGFISMFIYKFSMDYPHFQTPHAIAGLCAVLILLVNYTMGNLILKGKPDIKPYHRWTGRTGITLGILNMILGFVVYFLI